MAEKKLPNSKKAEIRKDVDTRLQSMTREDMENQSKIIIDKILKHPKYQEAKRISLFLSLPNEVPTIYILDDILARGAVPFVPQYSKGKMRMLRVLPGDLDIMVETSWKIKQHGQDLEREDALESLDNGGLDLVIAPGAAFTKDGWSVGHGGGYYDGYLSKLLTLHKADPSFRKPYILAVGFNQQVYDEVPVDAHNVKVDEVITAS